MCQIADSLTIVKTAFIFKKPISEERIIFLKEVLHMNLQKVLQGQILFFLQEVCCRLVN